MLLQTLLGIIAALFVLLGIAGLLAKPHSVYADRPNEKNPMEGQKVRFVKNPKDAENADGARGHLEKTGVSERKPAFYERVVKRALDILVSFFALLLLSPLLIGLSLAIVIDDPGPVFFSQKRVGRNKRYFTLHKFRSMKMSTPRDVPTHMLEDPAQYITKVGKFIRAHSLDELPQVWDIFLGNMSLIGPRPALWNQDLLTAERDRYGANDVRPGLTGWAQINGRDTLSIPDKAKLDGDYAQALSFKMDLRCFLGSVPVLRKDENIIEGSGAHDDK